MFLHLIFQLEVLTVRGKKASHMAIQLLCISSLVKTRDRADDQRCKLYLVEYFCDSNPEEYLFAYLLPLVISTRNLLAYLCVHAS